MPELRFIPNVAGEGEGLSDAGIETYRDDPFPAVARETSQNSRDAHDAVRRPDQPVRMDIEKFNVPANTLPGYQKYREVVSLCLDVAEQNGNAKEAEFFRQALRVLDSPEIAILSIADYNTSGLRGPCEEGMPFHSLVKSSGISSKTQDTSGGSFGIGKSAVYSASDLQTVFYSTSYVDREGGRRFLAQGKTKFRSFTAADGEHFRSVGYWGEPHGYMPVESLAAVPKWLRRQETGTTVCSIAVRESDDWQKEITASLIVNFFKAITDGQMVFSVDGDVLDERTLRRRFDDHEIESAARNEDFQFAKHMYECLTNDDESEEYAIEVSDAGRFRLRLMIKDGLPKRVGFLRNGMYICDNLAHFGDKFARFPMYRDFAAIVEPVDDESNMWLRRMENPRHDEFSPERILDPKQRRAAKLAGQRLTKQIRETIKTAAKSKVENTTDLQELSEFFALDNEGREDDEGSRKVKSFTVSTPPKPRPRRSKTPVSDGDGSSGGAGLGSDGGASGGGSYGEGVGTGTGGGGTRKSRKAFPLIGARTTLPDPFNPRRRRVLFTPSASGIALLKFEGSGLSNPQWLPVVEGECRIHCVEGARQEIEVTFLTAYDGPIEIVSWAAEEDNDEGQR